MLDHYQQDDVSLPPNHDWRPGESVVPMLCDYFGALLTPDQRQVVKALDAQALMDRVTYQEPESDEDRPDGVLDIPSACDVLTSSVCVQVLKDPVTALTRASGPPRYLPRLPFPVTIMETCRSDGKPNCWSQVEDTGNGWAAQLLAIVCVEVQPGLRWCCWSAIGMRGHGLIGTDMVRYDFTADGHAVYGEEGQVLADAAVHAPSGIHWGMALMAAVELSTIRGAVLTPTNGFVSRQQRRQFQRHAHITPPKIYRLKIGGAQPQGDHHPGYREYHCQWLVRGHWRDLGGRLTWVRPYVKGPEGAPFKGRPIYEVQPDD